MRLALSLDLDQLPVEDAEKLQKLVEPVELSHTIQPSGNQNLRDGFQYSITIETESLQSSFEVDDGSLSEQMRLLVNELVLRARSTRRTV